MIKIRETCDVRRGTRNVLWLIIFVILPTSYVPRVSAEDVSEAELLGETTSQADLTLIDPDLAAEPVPKLVLPPEPPAGLQLPELIVKSDEWRGVQCGVHEARHAVFQHTDKWTSFWNKALAPYSRRLAQVPPIDFAKDMVVGVFMGERTTPYYEIEIRSIHLEDQKEGGKALVVRYREISKMQGVFIPPFAVQPFHMKRVPRFDGPVLFTRVRR